MREDTRFVEMTHHSAVLYAMLGEHVLGGWIGADEDEFLDYLYDELSLTYGEWTDDVIEAVEIFPVYAVVERFVPTDADIPF